jgi:hypothetical protein
MAGEDLLEFSGDPLCQTDLNIEIESSSTPVFSDGVEPSVIGVLHQSMKSKSRISGAPDLKNTMSTRAYSFKKRKPLPGAYPRQFSPYTLQQSSNERAVSLSLVDIKNDLQAIHDRVRREFSSQYFDEGAESGHQPSVAVIFGNSLARDKIQSRVARRKSSTLMQAPQTEAEERKQIRAAIKASRLESAQTPDVNRGDLFDIETFSTEGDSDGVSTEQITLIKSAPLRTVCSGQIFRTG